MTCFYCWWRVMISYKYLSEWSSCLWLYCFLFCFLLYRCIVYISKRVHSVMRAKYFFLSELNTRNVFIKLHSYTSFLFYLIDLPVTWKVTSWKGWKTQGTVENRSRRHRRQTIKYIMYTITIFKRRKIYLVYPTVWTIETYSCTSAFVPFLLCLKIRQSENNSAT